MQDTPKNIFESNIELMNSFHPINKDLILRSLDPNLKIEEEFDVFSHDYLDLYEGIFVYGIQNGKWIESFLPWLDAEAKRRLIICDSSPKHYAHFFNLETAEKLITHPRLHLLLTPDGLNEEHLGYLKNIISTMIMTLNLKNALFLEHKQRADLSFTRKSRFDDAIEKGLSDYYASDMYLKGHNHKTIVNYYENISINQDAIHVSELKNAFKGQPIVLCAAGFSLPKIYEKLRSIQNTTLIAAAGTGASLLFKNGIDCHFNAILDVAPNKQHTSYYHNHQGVLFYLLRSGNQGVSQHQGFKVVCDSSFRSDFFEQLITDKTKLNNLTNMYWTVTDLLLEQLAFLGFSPIYLCGADHIMDKTKYYAEDVVKVEKNSCSEKMYIHAKNVKGEEVITKFDWHQGSKKMNELCLKIPETEIIYVTDDGLPIPNATTISTEEFCKTSFPNEGLCEDKYIPTFLNLKHSCISNKMIVEHLDKLIISFTSCKKIFERIDMELGKNFFAWQITPIDDLNPYTGVFFYLQKLLLEEIAYTEFLLPSWEQFKNQIHIDAGFYGEAQKAKLTLFALKTRELDYLKHQNMLFHNLFVLQKQQIIERSKKFNYNLEEDTNNVFEPVSLNN